MSESGSALTTNPHPGAYRGRCGRAKRCWTARGDTLEGAAIAKWGDIGRATVGSRQGLERILGAFEGCAMELKELVRSFRNILFSITGGWVRTFAESSGMYRAILKLFEDYVQMMNGLMLGIVS